MLETWREFDFYKVMMCTLTVFSMAHLGGLIIVHDKDKDWGDHKWLKNPIVYMNLGKD